MLISGDAGSNTCPDAAVWMFALPPGIWLPTNSAYNPDPYTWCHRSLNYEIIRGVADVDRDSDLEEFGPEADECSDFEDEEDLN